MGPSMTTPGVDLEIAHADVTQSTRIPAEGVVGEPISCCA